MRRLVRAHLAKGLMPRPRQHQMYVSTFGDASLCLFWSPNSKLTPLLLHDSNTTLISTQATQYPPTRL